MDKFGDRIIHKSSGSEVQGINHDREMKNKERIYGNKELTRIK